MERKLSAIEETSLSTYGVCCNRKSACSLSYESDEFRQLGQLLQAPGDTVILKGRMGGFTRFFQRNTVNCVVCHQPIVNTAALLSGSNIDAKRLDRVLRLRNQLLGLEILSA